MTPSKCSLVVVDDEPYILPALTALLADDFEVFPADSAAAAQKWFAQRPIDIILTDQRMPGMTGVQLLEWVRQHHPKTIRLLMTGYAELDDAVEAINRGQVYYYLSKPWRKEDLQQILRNAREKLFLERSREQLFEQLRHLTQELEQRVTDRTRELEQINRELEHRKRELETLALTDPLTGLLNRRAIDDVVRNELKRHARFRRPLALGILDADHFREINNRYLLTGGDQVLIELAKILTSCLRSVDTVGRIGGEEFLVVAPETNLEGAIVLAERIRSTVERSPIRYQDQLISVTVSLGFAVADAGVATDYDQMKHVAAQAEKEAKALGRNRCVIRSVSFPTGTDG